MYMRNFLRKTTFKRQIFDKKKNKKKYLTLKRMNTKLKIFKSMALLKIYI